MSPEIRVPYSKNAALCLTFVLFGALVGGCGGASGGARFLNADLGGCDGGCPCTMDNQCNVKQPRCDTQSGDCVECLPQSDNCTPNKKCVDFVCVPRCAKDADCPKGGPGTCCGGVCIDVASDRSHCGGCGMACPVPAGASAACAAGKCGIGACDPGRADCNKDAADGCEVRTDSDAKNCGSCGNGCTAGPNQQNGCDKGQCMPTCSPGFLHCSANSADGCEVNKNTDVKNCGACGMACPVPQNGTPSCAAGQCGIGQCNAGFGDCNRMSGDGCETSLTTVQDCGACGNVCPMPQNATAACNGGQCGIASCSPGFGDCNRVAGDGCEVNLRSDAQNCGGCGSACVIANGTPSCGSGVCGVAACNGGFGNCNNLAADGCEAIFASDAKNCGFCGNICPNNAPACVLGVCKANQYLPVGPQQLIPINTVTNGGWTECYRDAYANGATSLVTILQRCPGSRLMLACAQAGSATLTLLAQAPRFDVTFQVALNGAPHVANGTGWYYDPASSWGFANQGEAIMRNTCDTAVGATHLCWHASGGTINGGYRCGNTTGLNASNAWNRIIYQMP